MVQIETFAFILTGIGLAASIVYYANVLANSNKTRQTQLFMNLYDKYQSEEFRSRLFAFTEFDWERAQTELQKQNSRELWLNVDDDYVEELREALILINSVAAYFNGIGILVRKGMIDIELVDELLSFIIISQWEKIEPIMIEMRRLEKEPKLHSNFESLYKEIKKRNPS